MGSPTPLPYFIERRSECRLPYLSKVIITDGSRSMTAYAGNVSRGGMFVLTLDPFPIETVCKIATLFPEQSQSVCFKARVVHIVFDKRRCEVECGMGFQFLEVNELQRSILNVHVLNQKACYLEMKQLLSQPLPDLSLIEQKQKKISNLKDLDLLSLRYRVDRICTLFASFEESEGLKNQASA